MGRGWALGSGGAMDLPNVAAWLGHADATVTLRHYMKASELEAPAALDALVASGKTHRLGSGPHGTSKERLSSAS